MRNAKFSMNYINLKLFKNVRKQCLRKYQVIKYFFEQGPCNFSTLKKFAQQGGKNLLITRKN